MIRSCHGGDRKCILMNITTHSNKTLFSLGKDVLICAILLVVFAVITFYKLGDTSFPKSSYNFTNNEPVFIDFGKTVRFQGVVFLSGGNPNETRGQVHCLARQ